MHIAAQNLGHVERQETESIQADHGEPRAPAHPRPGLAERADHQEEPHRHTHREQRPKTHGQ